VADRVPTSVSDLSALPVPGSRREFLKRAAVVTLGIVGASVVADADRADAATYTCVATTPVRNGPCVNLTRIHR